LPPTGSRLIGHIKSYNPEHGYGFIKCPEIWQADVHFSRSLLPPEVQAMHWSSLAGTPVEFELLVNRDGKLRTERMWLLEPVMERPPPGWRDDFGGHCSKGGGKDWGKGGGRRERAVVEREGPPPPELDETTVQEMTKFLEEKGGAMDHGKFANAFPGVKKSQLEPHFVLVPEDTSYSGGRWQVMLPGVEEKLPRQPRKGLDAVEPLIVEPSATLRLIGSVKKWDRKRGYGFVEADGVDDVFLHRNDLPPEVRSWRGDFEGVELTFVLDAAAEGKLKAVDVHLLLVPDNEGGWQLRRVAAVEGDASGRGGAEDEEEEHVADEEGGEASAEAGTGQVVVEEEEEVVEEVDEAGQGAQEAAPAEGEETWEEGGAYVNTA